MKKLHYDNGYAIIVESIEEGASEYHVEKLNCRVEIAFKTAVAIKKFVAEVGERIVSKDEKKKLLEKKKTQQVVSTRLKMRFQDLPVGQPLWYEKTGFHYSFMNYYSDERYEGNVPTTEAGLKEAKKDKNFIEFYNDGMTGATADGESFKGYVDGLIKAANVISTR